MAIRQKGQVTLYDFTDKYTLDLPGSISLSAGLTTLGTDASRVVYTSIKRGNVALTTASTDPTIKLSGTPTVTITDCTGGGKSGSTLRVTVSNVSFDTSKKLLYFTLTFNSAINSDGSVLLAVAFTDSATGDAITLNEQINFSLSNKGSTGDHGINTATVFLYKRSSSTPAAPSNNVTYTFSNSTASGSDIGTGKWTQDIPTGNDTLYTVYATASSSGSNDTISSSEWQGPIKVEGTDGTPGTPGTDGWNRAIVYLYQRSATTPSAPSGTATYTFSSGTLTGITLGNWLTSIPPTDVNGNPCYVCSASFASRNSTATGTFANVIKLVEDGADGNDSYEIAIIANPTDRFVNTKIACTLTAYVSKGGVVYEDILNGDTVDEQLADEGLIVKWYKADGTAWMDTQSTPQQRTGVVQVITAGDVSNSISLVAQLEDIS